MKKRSPWAVFLLPIITLGIYSWYWEVKTKGEMNALGQKIPTAWLWLIPFFGYLWWAWKYSEGVGSVTKDKAPSILVFLLMIFTGNIGDAVIQHFFNQLPEGAAVGQNSAPVADAVPVDPVSPAPAPTAPVETPAPETPPAEIPAAPSAPEAAPTEEPPQPPSSPLVQ